MKKRRELKVGMKVKFEHKRWDGPMVGEITEILNDTYIKVGTNYGECTITRRQIISVFVPKKKVEPEEIWINQYSSIPDSVHTTRESAEYNKALQLRLRILRCHVVERIPVPGGGK